MPLPAIHQKLFRESHREIRLRPLTWGHSHEVEVRRLSLTPPAEKIMHVKDTAPDATHEPALEFN